MQTKTIDCLGLLNKSKGRLSSVSDCNSQVEGSDFDGPVLWEETDMEDVEDILEENGGIPLDHVLVKVTLTFSID